MYVANKSKDSTGYNYQNYDKYGNKYQENRKTYDGDHYYYNNQTGVQGYHDGNMTDKDRQNLKELNNLERKRKGYL